MSKFGRIAIAIVVAEILVITIVNMLLINSINNRENRQYRVECARVARAIKDGNSVDVDDYESIVSVHEYNPDAIVNNDYRIVERDGKIYQIEYVAHRDYQPVIYMDIGLGIALITTAVILVYVDSKILRPFNTMSNVSVELAKGNLAADLKEDKNKFYGKFVWGINMLRDNLVSNRKKELQLQKEKKTLILSISHDIKTPLSAIKLYNKALKDDLYDTEEKRLEAFEGINRNISDIERYVSEIVTASREDFLNLEANVGEAYLDSIISKIKSLYEDKFETLHTEFEVGKYSNYLLKCDADRLNEVLQNFLENAIKYGDGRYVKIRVDEEEDCCLISVTNSGCTITEDELPHLFDSFYRGKNSDRVEGSGLGLYIAKSLMHLMDGDVFARVDGDEFTVVAVVRIC